MVEKETSTRLKEIEPQTITTGIPNGIPAAIILMKTILNQIVILIYGGESGIRTHGRLTPTAVFKTAALNHSAISP
jgi:hypothetical protein